MAKSILISVLLITLFFSVSCHKDEDPVSSDPYIPGVGTWSLMNAQNTNRNGLADPWVRNIYFSETGKAFVATFFEGLSTYDGNNWDNDPWSYNSNYGYIPNDFLEDSQGRLWITSYHDVFRYENGELILDQELANLMMEYMNYTPDYYEVYAKYILEDVDGLIWIMTHFGPIAYDGEWHMYFHEDIFPSLVMYEPMFLDYNGHVTFYSHGTFFTYDGNEWIESPIFNTGFELTWGCECLYMDSSDRLWVMSTGYNTGLFDIYEFSNGAWTLHEIDTNYYETQSAFDIVEDDNGNIWFGRSSGLVKYDGNSFEFMEMGDCCCLAVHPNGDLWIGQDDGIKIYGDDNIYEINVGGLLSSEVIKMEEDADGTIWIMNRKGLSQYKNGQWLNNKDFGSDYFLRKSGIQFVDDNAVWLTNRYACNFTLDGSYINHDVIQAGSCVEATSGILYFPCDQYGLKSLNGETVIQEATYPCRSAIEYNGDILTGSYTVFNVDGEPFPYCIDNTNRSIPNFSSRGVDIENFMVDSQNNLWCMTFEGPSRFDGETWLTYSFNQTGTIEKEIEGYGTFFIEYENVDIFNGLNNFLGNSQPIAEDRWGNIWIGYQNLIAVFDGETWKQVIPDSPINVTITDILARDNGDIWFSTDGEGIWIYRP